MADADVLLVEGKNDAHVLWALLKHHQIPDRFEVESREGVSDLLETLPVKLKGSGFARLGIVLDADTDLAARWAALRNILFNAGAGSVPEAPPSEGSLVTVHRPDRVLTVGIWLMPNNQLPGMLEDFVALLVAPEDALWEYAADCLRRIPEPRFPPAHLAKAHIHTWLAWQEEPGTPLGLAITKRYLDASAPHAQQLIDWIRRLFDLI